MASSVYVHALLAEEHRKDPRNANAQMRGVAWWPEFVRDLESDTDPSKQALR